MCLPPHGLGMRTSHVKQYVEISSREPLRGEATENTQKLNSTWERFTPAEKAEVVRIKTNRDQFDMVMNPFQRQRSSSDASLADVV